ncbi:MAG: SDR family oxidoreductase [Methylococcales bacterium]|nr:SDR family oxidoreductase [Methylococcales bacterium]
MNRIAIITGASRGIGAATALRLADEGHDICVNYVKNAEAADSVVEKIQAKGQRAIAVQADVSQEDEVVALFEQVEIGLGKPSVLINNASILLKQSRLVEMTATRINQILTTNITSAFLCCREAIKQMSTRMGGNGGTIVNVSSAASRLGSAGEYIDYAASKGAIDTLTIGLAKEIAAEGIRVNGVRPGVIYTDIHTDGGEPGRADRLSSSLPMGRSGQAEEVAAAIAWLASDDSSYTTGSFIEVSGGR